VKTPDIVRETIDVVVAVLSRDGLRVEEHHRHLIESQVRDVWGGTRVYVGKRQDAEAVQRAKRDHAIVLGWQAGATFEELGFRHQLTPRRIKQIISGISDWKSDCLTRFHAHS
jgi:hypothetical protein